MGKIIVIAGTGVQGSTVAQRMDEEPNVEKIIVADYKLEVAERCAADLKKGVAAQVDASSKEDMVKLIEGADLLVNALPVEYLKIAIDAALTAGAGYQDFFVSPFYEMEGDLIDVEDPAIEDADPVASIKTQTNVIGAKFKEKDIFGICGTGSAPGLLCAATARAMRYLDTCDTIYNIAYEGLETENFIPFWWSPEVALLDMQYPGVVVEDGVMRRTEPYTGAIKRKYDYMPSEVEFVDHCHEEPAMYFAHADSHFRGVKNLYFKYGGVGVEFARGLYKTGLLSMEEVEFNGQKIIPYEFIVSHVPHPPKFKEEIEAVIEGGIVKDEGAMVVEAYGTKDGKKIKVESHVCAPGLVESFEKAGITAEQFLTGQSGSLFTKMFVNDDFQQKGLITSDMMNDAEIDKYFEYAAELGITVEDKVFEL